MARIAINLLKYISLIAIILLISLLYCPWIETCLIYFHWLSYPTHPILVNLAKPQAANLFFQGIANTTYIQIENINVLDNSSSTLGGWLISSNCSSSSSSPHYLLFFHGNAESRAYPVSLNRYSLFRNPPICSHIIAFDYTGFGDSSGFPSVPQFYQDSLSLYRFATKTLKIPPQKIIFYAHSLGSAAVIQFLARYFQNASAASGELGEFPAGLILEAPFTSIAEVVLDYIPFSWLSDFQWVRDFLNQRISHKFESLRSIVHSSSHAFDLPILILHGKQDFVINYRHSVELFNAFLLNSSSANSENSQEMGEFSSKTHDIFSGSKEITREIISSVALSNATEAFQLSYQRSKLYREMLLLPGVSHETISYQQLAADTIGRFISQAQLRTFVEENELSIPSQQSSRVNNEHQEL
jgi:pimeloyl-ACP methyl ester carboxylesterase